MTHTTDLVGKPLALLTRGTDAHGEEDVWLQTGRLVRADGRWVLERDPDRKWVALEEAWLDRIEPVPDNFRKTFRNAELLLLVDDALVPDVADIPEPMATGMAVG